MDKDQALKVMLPPGAVKAKKFMSGVIQIWVTRACDKSCFGCTQGSNLRGKPSMITPEQFEQACISLKTYFGVVGMFGGNPATHPEFDTLCEIMRKHIPKNKCGLWCNNLLGKGESARKTFNPTYSNINVHLDQKAFSEFKSSWPEVRPVGSTNDSRHSPPFVSMLDLQELTDDKERRWDLIADCDINKYWSAMVCTFRGQLRGFFCEIAGAQAMLHEHEEDYPDLGIPIDGTEDPPWWFHPMSYYANQVEFHCHRCGVPLRGYGELSQSTDPNSVEITSEHHKNIYNPKRPDRTVRVIDSFDGLYTGKLQKITDYLGNAKR